MMTFDTLALALILTAVFGEATRYLLWFWHTRAGVREATAESQPGAPAADA